MPWGFAGAHTCSSQAAGNWWSKEQVLLGIQQMVSEVQACTTGAADNLSLKEHVLPMVPGMRAHTMHTAVMFQD
eukprot:scaffold37557_cov17-Tisochrysis_lutea.AAC.1